MKKLKFYGLFSILSMLLTSTVLATSQDPVQFLKQRSENMIQALKQQHSALQKNPKLVLKIVNTHLIPYVDTNAMSQQVLGRSVWHDLSQQQRNAFSQAFIQLVIRTYASALSSYNDETIRFYPLRAGEANRPRVQVRSVIQREGRRIPVDYWLLRRPQGWRVYDLSVEGISLLQSFKSQFSAKLSQKGFDAVLKKLKAHNNMSP